MEARLILFDIDQTLVHTDFAGMKCLTRALTEVCQTDLSAVRPDGKTDPAIIREALRHADWPAERWRGVEEEVFLRYAAYLEEELAIENPRRCLKPGVSRLLARLEEEPWAYLGLLTGNMERTGFLKLRCLGIDGYFPVGGYGSDCADRCRLGAVALERARRHYGVPFEPEHTWVIGDTPHDVEAAHAVGARAMAVATGRSPLPQLEECLPAVALQDLSDVERVLQLLRS